MRQQLIRKVIGRMFLVAIALFGIGIGAGVTVSEASAPDGVKDGVAVIAECGRIKSTNTYAKLAWGSTFFVGTEGENPQYLVTNYHVIADYDQLGGGEKVSVYDNNGVEYDKLVLRVYFDEDTYVEAYPLEVNIKMDVAVLYLEKPTDQRKALPVRVPSEEDVGDPVYAYGFPGIADTDLTDAVSEWSLSDITITSGIVSRLATVSGTGVRQVQTDTEFWHGNSGGPLVTEEGDVIGITSSGVNTTSIKRDGSIEIETVKYAVSMAEVEPLLDRNNVSHYSLGDSTVVGTDDNGDDNGDVSDDVEDGEDTGDTDTEKKGESDNLIMIIIIAAVVVVVIIVIIILIAVMSSKKKKAATPAPQVRPNMPPQGAPMQGGMPQGPQGGPMGGVAGGPAGGDRSVSVQATSGMLSGRTFQAGPDGRITFGRQPSCQVVFGANDKNVSGNHCVVYKKNGQIILMDVGSTNGTFLENGTKLQPNIEYPMNPGDRFYLVNSEYVFKVW